MYESILDRARRVDKSGALYFDPDNFDEVVEIAIEFAQTILEIESIHQPQQTESSNDATCTCSDKTDFSDNDAEILYPCPTINILT